MSAGISSLSIITQSGSTGHHISTPGGTGGCGAGCSGENIICTRYRAGVAARISGFGPPPPPLLLRVNCVTWRTMIVRRKITVFYSTFPSHIHTLLFAPLPFLRTNKAIDTAFGLTRFVPYRVHLLVLCPFLFSVFGIIITSFSGG